MTMVYHHASQEYINSTKTPMVCKTCRWYREIGTECRRYPPTLVMDEDEGIVSYFPQTGENVWCGEWTDKNA